jgi:hypothetical protein
MAVIHSIVNVITNSSTEIYTTVLDDAEKTAKALITKLMHMMGATVSAEECFEVSIGEDDYENKCVMVKSKITGEEIDLNNELFKMIDQHAENNS